MSKRDDMRTLRVRLSFATVFWSFVTAIGPRQALGAMIGLFVASSSWAGQGPGSAKSPDIPITHRDRVYAAEQFSNTVSVVDPASNALLGVIRLGEPQPANFSPLYKGQVLVHGMGFSPDHSTLAVVSIGSNSVTFIDTATNAVKHTTYVGRAPHEAFFTPDGSQVWVTIRGENYVSVIDSHSFAEIARVVTPAGPGMTIFSPDGKYAYVCSSFTPETDVIDVATRATVARLVQPSPFCPNIAATPDGEQVWYTLKDIGKVVAINARPPFNTLASIDTGPITNHVNFVDTRDGKFAYVTVGGLNEVLAFRRSDFAKTATVQVGNLPHGIWPSGDGSRVYVGLENGDALAAIDTHTNKVVSTIPIGQGAQAVNYVPDAVKVGDGRQRLVPLGIAGNVVTIKLTATGQRGTQSPTSVSLFDQGLVQVLQAAVTGLSAKSPYLLSLAGKPDGTGALEPLAAFTTNAAGAAIVNAVGPIRQIVRSTAPDARRYLVISAGKADAPGPVVQIQNDR